MALTRRSFIKIIGTAAGALLVSLGLQNATMRNIKAEYVPGAGHMNENNTNKDEYYTRIDNIDTSAFLSGCSRCGVCLKKCPFNAIKSESVAVPQLTDFTARKCPGYEKCGMCATVCPTDCLNEAFKNFRDLTGFTPIVEDKPGWWEGPYEVSERDPPT